ncbi:hypothetical protein BH11VER1_BH11VER1_14150 [soil metagenome]
MQQNHSDTIGLQPFTESDFYALPAKSLSYRGITFTRSTLLRLNQQQRVKLARFRFTGKTKPRLYVLRESLDDFIKRELASPETATA